MSSRPKARLSLGLASSANKLKLNSINKILKVDSLPKKKQNSDSLARQVSKVALSDLLGSSFSQTIPDFKSFLSDQKSVEEFRDFLKTQYCQENIDFYLACDRYRKLDVDKVGRDLIVFMATQIYNDFLGENAKQPVNIDYECLQRIKRQRREPTSDLFNEAQQEIYNLMRTDCYPRFCKTWRVDRKTAKRILTEKLMNSSIKSSQISFGLSNTTKSSLTDVTISSISTDFSKPHTRESKRKHESPRDKCPPECPYYRVGLPCRHHLMRSEGDEEPHEECGRSDLIDQLDLGRIHRVPQNCVRRNPLIPSLLSMKPPSRPPPPPPVPLQPAESMHPAPSPPDAFRDGPMVEGDNSSIGSEAYASESFLV